jgi:hypothetical protein
MGKCQLAPIRYSEGDLSLMMEYFSCAVVDFPLHYFGFTLSVTKAPFGTAPASNSYWFSCEVIL